MKTKNPYLAGAAYHRITTLILAALSLPAAITASMYHVPGNFPLVQSAIDASASGDTIICDTVKDVDTIRIVEKVNLFVKGPLSANATKVARVVLIKSSTCTLEFLSFAGAAGVDGNNNNSCKSVPALDGKAGADAIITDSSSVTLSGCTVRGGNGGSYGVSYQSSMVCYCGAKGAPGNALRSNHSTITLRNDSLISGFCSGVSIAGCFTNNCTEPGLGCLAEDSSMIDTVDSKIDTISLDSTSTMGPATTAVHGRQARWQSLIHPVNFKSGQRDISIPDDFSTPFSMLIYTIQGNLIMQKTHVVAKQFSIGTKLAQGVYVISLQSAERKLTDRLILSK